MSVADASSISATGKAAPCKSPSAFQWLDFLEELLHLSFARVQEGIWLLPSDEGREQIQLIAYFSSSFWYENCFFLALGLYLERNNFYILTTFVLKLK